MEINFYNPGRDVGVDVDAVITRILINVSSDIESTRAALERSGRKVIDDVRDASETVGTLLLRGVETEIDYDSLVKINDALLKGIARRQVALET